MEAAASTGNRKQPRFPAAAWKTLRVSHSSHGPQPLISPTAHGLEAVPAIGDTHPPSPGVAAFQPFPPGRFSTSGDKYAKPKALSILAHKLGRAVYFMLARNQAFDIERFAKS